MNSPRRAVRSTQATGERRPICRDLEGCRRNLVCALRVRCVGVADCLVIFTFSVDAARLPPTRIFVLNRLYDPIGKQYHNQISE